MKMIVVVLGVLLVATGLAHAAEEERMRLDASTAADAPAEGEWFLFAADFMVPDPQKAAQVQDFAKEGAFDLWGLYPPITPEVMEFIREGNDGFLYFLPASDTIMTNFQHLVPRGAVASVEFVEGERAKVQDLTKSMGGRIWWDVMPEFESSMSWPSRKLRPTNPTRVGFYRQWSDGYLSLQPLGRYLQMTPKQRGFNLASTTGFSCHTHYAYELGSQLNMLERDNDDIGDLTTGIAFARGAGRQYSRPWGIDISVWRCATDSIPEFDENGRLTGGWSPEYVKRHLYLSYMAGANMIRMEPTGYHDREGERNPIGQLVVDFGRFAREHPNRGRPQVSTAVMLDFYHGFEPKYGEYTQGDSVWYNQIPYSAGDHMTNNFLRLAFPDHWLSGTTPGAFWAPNQRARENPKEMRDRMKQGMDPRPYEPMGTSRWGDHIDVLLSNAPLSALRKYKTILLVGDVALEGTLSAALTQWVEEGGTLVANTAHVSAEDEALLGVTLTGQTREGVQSRWLEDAAVYQEPKYQYAVVTLAGAEVLADDGNGAPLIARQQLGKGEVILSTADHLYAADDPHRLLRIGERLYDSVMDCHLPVEVKGPALEYLVNRGADSTIVTLVNNSGAEWTGSISTSKPASAYETTEWLLDGDRPVQHEESDGKVSIPLTIPPYDLRIIAVESQPAWL